MTQDISVSSNAQKQIGALTTAMFWLSGAVGASLKISIRGKCWTPFSSFKSMRKLNFQSVPNTILGILLWLKKIGLWHMNHTDYFYDILTCFFVLGNFKSSILHVGKRSSDIMYKISTIFSKTENDMGLKSSPVTQLC